jgi:hypothetical protein
MKPKKLKYFTTRKYMGDDAYSWAVFRKGVSNPICSGCSKNEARYHAGEIEKNYIQMLTDQGAKV